MLRCSDHSRIVLRNSLCNNNLGDECRRLKVNNLTLKVNFPNFTMQYVSNRAKGRAPFPDMDRLSSEINETLAAHNLPLCHRIEPVADGDTMNPNLIGHSASRKYVIKVATRNIDSLAKQMRVANKLKNQTSLPIPKHLCFSSEKDRIPLLIMEFLSGVQLREALSNAEGDDLNRLCANLANCYAEFNDPNLLEITEKSVDPAKFAKWFLQKTEDVLSAGETPMFLKKNTESIQEFLNARMPEMSTFAIPSLTKNAMDLRDWLVDPENMAISGMLDWEDVKIGDGIYDICVFYLRLWLNGKLEGWNAFQEAYNATATMPLVPTPQAEFFLMVRAVIASQNYEIAMDIIEALLAGKCQPLLDNECQQ